MENIDFLNLKVFMNQNYCMIISLQGRVKVVHLDESVVVRFKGLVKRFCR